MAGAERSPFHSSPDSTLLSTSISSHSYFYPVRSLLGSVQPAPLTSSSSIQTSFRTQEFPDSEIDHTTQLEYPSFDVTCNYHQTSLSRFSASHPQILQPPHQLVHRHPHHLLGEDDPNPRSSSSGLQQTGSPLLSAGILTDFIEDSVSTSAQFSLDQPSFPASDFLPLIPSVMTSRGDNVHSFGPSEISLPPLNIPLSFPLTTRDASDAHVFLHEDGDVAFSDTSPNLPTPGPISYQDRTGTGYHDSTGSLCKNRKSIEPSSKLQFDHVEEEDGNCVVFGHEGQLQRCEDEPIRTPGAVQAFGVLIAVQEIGDALVVRQVSENSTDLLGLSPNWLFSLRCFTDTLPESQADLLWDNIEFLGQPEDNLQNDGGEAPHVFLISGWGAPGSEVAEVNKGRRLWTCWCAVHRLVEPIPESSESSPLIIMEFELEEDAINPLCPPAFSPSGFFSSMSPLSRTSSRDINKMLPKAPVDNLDTVTCSESLPRLEGQDDWLPSTEDIIESTTSYARPLPALERLRRMHEVNFASNNHYKPANPSRRKWRHGRQRTRSDGIDLEMMDIFAVLAQVNEQLGAVTSLDLFLKVVVGILKDLTQFHRVLVYKFDEAWNGEVVAELVDWSQTRDLYKGLHFPASDIPAQARALYCLNKVRLLYDRSQPTARIVVKNKEDLEVPLDMTHCYLRAMSPIHIKYLANMGVRASMSVSIMAFGTLWGLITCHSYGFHGMRVSFPIRQMLRLLSQSVSRNVERLSYAQRLHTRKLVNTMISDRHPSGYIVSNVNDLLALFDADFGVLVVGEEAKILGPNQHGQEILIITEYLRLKQYRTIQASQAVIHDFPDFQPTVGLEAIAGILLVPLSSQGTDFIGFLRKGQPKLIKWAGKPYKDGVGEGVTLEPRQSFKIWAETVAGRCRPWTDEQLETAGVLALVYGKFIEIWRQKENALQTTQLKNILLSNASHEVRTPLNHIINYLEMALNGPLDAEARENLNRSHVASKSLLFTINDLLELTRLESGNETSFHELFDLRETIEQATHLYRQEAKRRSVNFKLELDDSPRAVIGDAEKIRTVVQNLTANALKYSSQGSVMVRCLTSPESEGLRDPRHTVVEILVADEGCGIPSPKLEHIFREFEQVETLAPTRNGENSGIGLGLAVAARIIKQLGGQLRVDSKVDEGTRISLFIPLAVPENRGSVPRSISTDRSEGSVAHHRTRRQSFPRQSGDRQNTVKTLVYGSTGSSTQSPRRSIEGERLVSHTLLGPKTNSATFASQKSTKCNILDQDIKGLGRKSPRKSPIPGPVSMLSGHDDSKLRVLIVEDNDINRIVLAKRLCLDGHTVVNTTNGQECVDTVKSDSNFDVILMDIQMPILNGFKATEQIRRHEKNGSLNASTPGLSHSRIPILAVSASLLESQYNQLLNHGLDGWILKPIDFRRLRDILRGVIDPLQRQGDIYYPGYKWEVGGWLQK